MRIFALLLALSFSPAALSAQNTPPPTPGAAQAQGTIPTPPNKPDDVAGIPVNYDEAKVGTYTLPSALVMANGKVVLDAKAWTTLRRPEIVRLFESQQFGVAPGRPKDESFEVFDRGTPALDGKALRKQVVIYLSNDKNGPKINLLEYLPARQATAGKPVPMLLSINFGPPQFAVDDPGIRPVQVWEPKTKTRIDAPTPARPIGRINAAALLDAGIGVATFYYGDVEPDYEGGGAQGIRLAGEFFRSGSHSRRLAAGQDGDGGGCTRRALCRRHRQLLRRGWCGTQPSQLRRNHCAPDRAHSLPLPICSQLCKVRRFSGYRAYG